MFGTYCRLNVHLSASNVEVVKQARKKLNPCAFINHRESVKAFYREMIDYHQKERQKYQNARF